MADGIAPTTILLVDDEESICQLLTRFLERHGYRVLSTGDGQEAMTLFVQHKHQIKCVLLDMLLHGTSGTDVLHALRTMHPSLGVVLMSGAPYDHTAQPLLDARTRWLSKPFLLTELLGLLDELLQQQRNAGA